MRLIIVFSFLLSIISIKAQLKLIDPSRPNTDLNNTTIEVSGNPSDSDLEFPLSVINTSSTQNYTIKCRRTEVDVLSSTSNTTCWVLCPPFINSGVQPIMIVGSNGVEYEMNVASGDTAIGFVAHYNPHNIDGCSLFKYEFFDSSNPNTALGTISARFMHNVQTSCTASINDWSKTKFSMFPNPANNSLTLDVNQKMTAIKVVDVLGKTVVEETLLTQKKMLDVSNLKNGVYFVSILNQEGTILNTKKLIVKH